MIGTAMETQWGTFRYNLYILIGYIATMLVALIPGAIVSGFYLIESIFFGLRVAVSRIADPAFFCLPVKVKWLGLAAWIWYLYAFVTGNGDQSRGGGGDFEFCDFFP